MSDLILSPDQQKLYRESLLEHAITLFSGRWPQWADPWEAEPALAPPSRSAAFVLELRLPNQYTDKTTVLWHRFNYLVLPDDRTPHEDDS